MTTNNTTKITAQKRLNSHFCFQLQGLLQTDNITFTICLLLQKDKNAGGCSLHIRKVFLQQWQFSYIATRSRIKVQVGPGRFLLERPYDVIHDVIVCKKHVFADSQNKRFPFVFSDNRECGYSNAHTVSCDKRVYDIDTSRRATRVGIWGICPPPEIFKTLYSNFDI